MVAVCNSYTATTFENGHRDLLLCEFVNIETQVLYLYKEVTNHI